MNKFPFLIFPFCLLLFSNIKAQTPIAEKSLVFAKSTSKNKTNGIDTLNRDTVFAKSGNVYLYKNSGGGYVFGTNKINGQMGFSQIAQKQLNVGNLDMVTEVLIWFGAKTAGTGTSLIDVSVRNILPGSATGGELPNGTLVEGPGSVIGNLSQVSFSSADTSSLGLIFTTVPITNASNISGNFFILVDFTNCYSNADSIGIWADKNGDGFLGAYSKYGNTWYQSNTAYQNTFDVNMAVFAVVEQSSSLQEQDFFNGVKMNLYPNPTENYLNIKFITEKYTETAFIEIINQEGKVVNRIELKDIQENSVKDVSFDINELEKGIYYFSLFSGNNYGRITKKFVKQ